MFGSGKNKITLESEVYEIVKQASELSGCSSVEEFASQILMRESQAIVSNQSAVKTESSDVAKITEKLRGLGYLE